MGITFVWKYIRNRTLWHIGLTVAAILMVGLLFYLLIPGGPAHYFFGE